MTSSTDANGQTTTMEYNDSLNRPTAQIRPSGGGRTDFQYSDTVGNLFVRTLNDLDATRRTDGYQYFDGLGRSWRSRRSEGTTSIYTDTQYDFMDRVGKVSNPYRSGETVLWTTTAYDALGRVTSVTTPDNAVVATSYSGNTTTVSDQINKKRKSETDALGRLTKIYEDPDSQSLLTTYEYDVLDNLTRVIQDNNPQQPQQPPREFVYDSLKRLNSATNPESGTVSYQYDNNGNLTRKTDARGVFIDYVYDALNRNTTVDYSDTSSINPDITRIYDTGTNGKGMLRESYAGGSETVGTNVEHTKIESYDAVGHPKDLRQRFKTNGTWSAIYQTLRNYNLAGGVELQTYPSGRTVSYSYDDAGRTNSFTGYLGNVSRTYSTGIVYSPFGGMSQEQFGTDAAIYNKSLYNSRGQLSEIRVGTAPDNTGYERGAIINQYSFQCWGAACNGTDNNGNLKKQEVYIPNGQGSDTAWYQQYDYDNLNRLQRVHEYTINPSLDWQQEYVYDRWGNRTIHQSNTWGPNIPKPNFGVNPVTNQLTAPSGSLNYDAAGNLTNDNYPYTAGQRTYDAENRMTQAWANNQWQVYTYNADAQRVRRKVNGVETWQVYGMEGELVAEYAANAAPTSPQKEYGYRNGQLLITASPGTSSVSTENISWTDLVGVSASGNSLTKTAAAGWNAGAISTQAIASGDGYVEFTASADLTDRLCGLSVGNSGQGSGDVDFAIYLSNGGFIYAFEGGVEKANGGSYATGDHLRVTVASGVVKYSKNGSVFYTSSATPSYPLLVDTAFYTNGAMVSNALLSGNLISTATENVSWTDLVGVSASGNSLTKTAAAGWNAGAISTKAIASGDGYVEFTASADLTDRLCGLSVGNSGQGSGDVDFAIYLSNGGYIYAFEGGVEKANGGSYATGDHLRVTVASGVVKYSKNGSVFYTSSATPSYPLLVDTALYPTGSIISNVIISGNLGAGASGVGDSLQWLVADQLGTPRMIFDQTGSLANTKRHDYLPFGEELFTSTGSRATVQGYTGDSVRQKFTRKERDNETGLDYFLARYYSNAQGRFTSVDPENAGANPSDPQSWNGYAYARNSPLVYSDPDGRTYTVCDSQGKNCVDYRDSEFDKLRKGGPADGYTFKDGNIYYNGELTGTYSNDCLSCEGLINGMAQRAPAMEKAILAFGAMNLLPAAGIVGSMTAAGGGLTTLGLGTTTTTAAPSIVGSAFSQATLRAFQRQLAQHGRAALEKSLTSFEKRLAEHLLKIEAARRAGGYTSSMEKEVKIFRESIAAIKQILEK